MIADQLQIAVKVQYRQVGRSAVSILQQVGKANHPQGTVYRVCVQLLVEGIGAKIPANQRIQYFPFQVEFVQENLAHFITLLQEYLLPQNHHPGVCSQSGRPVMQPAPGIVLLSCNRIKQEAENKS